MSDRLSSLTPALRIQETERTRARYDRIAGLYDRREARVEGGQMDAWRKDLWKRVRGPRVLELGVGTGKNFPYYRTDLTLTGIDLSPNMLQHAQRRAARAAITVDLRLGDAQALPFDDASFDTVVATFVFCSIPDPVQGLREARRVLVPGGQLILHEHVLSHHVFLNLLMRGLNPLVVRLSGANIDRETVQNVETAEFTLHQVHDLMSDMVKLIEAERPLP